MSGALTSADLDLLRNLAIGDGLLLVAWREALDPSAQIERLRAAGFIRLVPRTSRFYPAYVITEAGHQRVGIYSDDLTFGGCGGVSDGEDPNYY